MSKRAIVEKALREGNETKREVRSRTKKIERKQEIEQESQEKSGLREKRTRGEADI